MDTRLIYVDKKTAEVKNDKDGSFTNAISEGIVVKQGDSISLEGIAINSCLLYTSPSPRDRQKSRMPSSA